MLGSLRARAKHLKDETYALYLACKDPRVPWYVKFFAALVVAHTVSPIDLIPDFIPVLGYLDDLVITPLGLFIALRMIPADVMIEARQRAAAGAGPGAAARRAGVVIVLLTWAVVLTATLALLMRMMQERSPGGH
jgi:uncharacterized membrane protein YkvA (DUF1232 family)